MKIEMTIELARAAAWDAADKRMRKAGRSQWTRGDYNHACREFERLARLIAPDKKSEGQP